MAIPDGFDYDSAIQKADRHVAEGRKRLTRQRALVERLTQDGHDKLAAEARNTLIDMERMQREFEQHAADQRRLADDCRKRRLMLRSQNPPKKLPDNPLGPTRRSPVDKTDPIGE